MKLLIHNAASLTGQALVQLLESQQLPVVFPDPELLEAVSAGRVSAAASQAFQAHLRELAPDQLVNLAFESHLPEAHAADIDYRPALRITKALAKASASLQIPMLQRSAANVFDGRQTRSYTEEDVLQPRDAFGEALVEAERLLGETCPHYLILRTDCIFSAADPGWFNAHLENYKKQEKLQLESFRFSPTPARDIARVLLAIAWQLDCDAQPWGIYHYCALQGLSQVQFVEDFLRAAASMDKKLARLAPDPRLEELPPAADAAYSNILSCKKIMSTFGIKQRSRIPALEDVVTELYTRRKGKDGKSSTQAGVAHD